VTQFYTAEHLSSYWRQWHGGHLHDGNQVVCHVWNIKERLLGCSLTFE